MGKMRDRSWMDRSTWKERRRLRVRRVTRFKLAKIHTHHTHPKTPLHSLCNTLLMWVSRSRGWDKIQMLYNMML